MRKGIYVFYLVAILLTLLLGSSTRTFAHAKANTEECKGCVFNITTTYLPNGTVGEPYQEIIQTVGYAEILMFSVSIGDLPVGLSLDPSSGEISGTPQIAGVDTFTISAFNGDVTRTMQYIVTIDGPACNLAITTTSLPDAKSGDDYYYGGYIAYTGSLGPVTASISQGTLPPGLSFDYGTTLSGSLQGPGVYPFTVKIEDGTCSAEKELSITVKQCDLAINTTTLPSVKLGDRWLSTFLNVTGGNNGALSPVYSVTQGSLTPGYSIGYSGELNGVATTEGSYTFTVKVAKDEYCWVEKELTMNVVPCGLQITTDSLLSPTKVGEYPMISFWSTGGNNSYAMMNCTLEQGTLPPGMNLVSNSLVGSPTTAGTYTFTLKGNQDQYCYTTKTFTLKVSPCIEFTTTSLPDAKTGESYSEYIDYSGGWATASITEGALPQGLTLSEYGWITGTPTQGGDFNFTYQLYGSASCSATKDFTLHVNSDCNLAITTQSLPDAKKGVPYETTIEVTGGTGAITYSLEETNLPDGLSLNTTTGLISGTPTTSGEENFVFVQATDEAHCVSFKNYNLNIGVCTLEVSLDDFTPVCNNADPVELTGGMPLGGTYSGAGVHSGSFFPLAGEQTITYTYTDVDQCTASASKVFPVHMAPIVTLGNFEPKCNNVREIALTGGLPEGGVYSGTGVTGERFNPAVGTQTITYTYTDANNCTAEASATMTIKEAPVVTLAEFNPACSNVGEIILTGGLPLGGVYTGTNVKSGTFDPKDGAQMISYKYTDLITTCASNATREFPVNMAPAVSMLPFTACANEGTITLNAGSPAGGIYTGTGVSDNTFNTSAGTQTIQYAYTDNKMCTSKTTRTLIVNEAPAVTLADFTPMCSNAGTIELSGGLPAGGVYSGTGVTANTFDASAGTQLITYTYTDNNTGCTAKTTKQFNINTIPSVTLAAFEPVCSKDGIITLTGGFPSGGTYTGVGVSGAQFDPSAGTQEITYTFIDDEKGCTSSDHKVLTVNTTPAVEMNDFAPVCSNAAPVTLTGGWPAGGTYTIGSTTVTTIDPANGTQNVRYTYTTEGGCSNTVSKTFMVNTPPTVTLASFEPVCTNTGTVILRGGQPLGGTYSGTGVSSSNLFDPSAGSQVITYTYTDNNGCSSKQNGIMTVRVAPVVTLEDFTAVGCADWDVVSLNGGLPEGGTYSGVGVENGTFAPANGTQLITYSYTDNNGCTSETSKSFPVNGSPEVTFPALAPVCSGSGVVQLNGGFPTGGVYTGTGVAAGQFDPSAGTQTITYMYTDNTTGCTGSVTQLQAVEVCTGVEEISADVTKCFPNPALNVLNVSIVKANKGNLDIRLVDMAGKVLATDLQGNVQGAYQTTFDLSKLATGMYIVEIRNGNSFSTQKVVKQ